MTIQVSSYKIEDIQKAAIQKLIEENPFKTLKEYAKMLGVHERTLIRWKEIYNLSIPDCRKSKQKSVIEELLKQGYSITKNS